MFGRKKEGNATAVDRIDTVIGRESLITGTLKATGTVRIDGQFSGEIVGKGDIIIGETGRVEATIESRNVIIAGTVHGNIDASGRLEIASTGRLYGDLTATSLIIDEGAVFHGSSRTETRPSRAVEEDEEDEEALETAL
ncbi:cell shape determination protein CcmA [Heliobacterium gestii]|uniref:Cell shape determination protein CcmA n=1 Tax=Heliomicrobium gestii TaxID=2699 RepID=A0A845LBH5_HELGE|nr:polymer-forming cytoskeletal protein [Heliomicrobium gestii]MBM7867754.1 cytoskeletal protein CcmA (bactofilin family) [Heliomicrobium gestii]MZP44147.1 cell shape determination protein CcmA [Heliomicrobium gestii]